MSNIQQIDNKKATAYNSANDIQIKLQSKLSKLQTEQAILYEKLKNVCLKDWYNLKSIYNIITVKIERIKRQLNPDHKIKPYKNEQYIKPRF